MKVISSNILYYRLLVILIIGPVFLYLFVNFMFYKTSPFIVILIIYAFLAFIFIRGWLNVSRFKKISYDNTKFIFVSYFTNKKIEVPLSDVKEIKEVYGKLTQKNVIMFYKILFTYKNKNQYVFFYKSLDFFGIDDLENYIDLKRQGD